MNLILVIGIVITLVTGVPVLINTSFNVRGEPVVCTPRDAINAFYSTPIDALVIGRCLLLKEQAA